MLETEIRRPLNGFIKLCIIGDQVSCTKVTAWTGKPGIAEHFLELGAFVLDERSEAYLFITLG